MGIFKPSQPEAEEPNENTFETTSVSALHTPNGSQTLDLQETQPFGSLTARYYVCAPGIIKSGTWTDYLELAKPPEATVATIPEGLDFRAAFCPRGQQRGRTSALRLRPGG